MQQTLGKSGCGQSSLWSKETGVAERPFDPDGRLTLSNLRKLLESQGYRCALTGDELTPDNCSLDHIRPVSRSGENTMGNVQLVTSEVNRVKQTMTTEELLAICRKVVGHLDSEGA